MNKIITMNIRLFVSFVLSMSSMIASTSIATASMINNNLDSPTTWQGAFVKTPNGSTLKTANEIYVLDDEKNILSSANHYKKESMIQAFRLCVRGNLITDNKLLTGARINSKRKVIRVNGLCDVK